MNRFGLACGLDALDFLQRLDAALRLSGFGRFGAKTLNKALHFTDLFLLVGGRLFKLRLALGFLGFERIVIAVVNRELAPVQMDNPVDNSV